MLRETLGKTPSSFDQSFKDPGRNPIAKSARFHWTLRHNGSGKTYGGLHERTSDAMAAIKKLDSTVGNGVSLKQLKEGELHTPGDGSGEALTHGKDDGTHDSVFDPKSATSPGIIQSKVING